MTDQVPKPSAEDPTLDQPYPQVALVLDQYLDDIQNGRACSREELLEKHPDIKDALTEYLGSIEMVAGLSFGDDLLVPNVGDFEIVKPIGCGAMGIVYLANQVSLKRQVALKVLRYTVVGEQATKRFEREAELVAKLRHEHIVPIYTTGQQNSTHYLAMRLIDGESLSEWNAKEDVRRDPKTIARWGAQVARALAHAHQRDVIHRDVKPSNLLLENDHVWLSDFGLARRYDDVRMSMTGAMLGTPNYMSPEQAAPAGPPIDHRCDIYSLGATLFELLTGRCVFIADTPHAVLAQVIAEEPPPLRAVEPKASRDLETILLKCLEKDPATRYQTADQLADDLEAFAEDRSIKARRPSLAERFSRWKRKNQSVVSAALIAASAAVMLLAVSVAAWLAWQKSITGTVEFASSEGPFVGRLIDESGNASPTFTIPTEDPLPFVAGEHTLQTWSGGRLGESRRISISARKNKQLATKLSQDGVFEDRIVVGVPQVLPLGDRDDLLFFHTDGLTRIDGRSGKELWSAKSEEFIAAIGEKSFKRLVAKTKAGADVADMEAPVMWSVPDHQLWYDEEGGYNKPFTPTVVARFPDVNDDGHQDVMIACPRQALLFVFGGKGGKLLWHYNAGIAGEQSHTIRTPMSLGDIDGDEIEDFGALFVSHSMMGNNSNPKRWMDAISGKTGKLIWRRSIPSEVFDVPANLIGSSFCKIEILRGGGCHMLMQLDDRDWKYRSQRYKLPIDGELVPWDGIRIPDSKTDSGEQLLLVCGSKIISCDPITGEPSSFNGGQAFELGGIPALQPQVIKSSDQGQETLGLLLTEIVSLAESSKNTKPVTRFSMRSLESGEELWRFDADYDLEWCPDSRPNWPVIADVTGDSVPEILVAHGTDLENKRPRGLASLQALDARTGEPIWGDPERAKIRSLDRQIQYALIGPDEDNDGLDDIYVVSPMANSKCWIFVDILSGVTGKRLRTVSSEIPVFQQSRLGFAIEKPFFIETGLGGQSLVVASRARFANFERRHSTIVMSVATGELICVGDQLEHPLLADGDGDGLEDLFLLRPRDRSKLFKSNQLVTFRAGGGGLKFSGAGLTAIEDVDGDGVRDLLDGPIGTHLPRSYPPAETERRVVSGANGKVLSEWEYRWVGNALYPAGGDFDNDGVNDFLATWQTAGESEKFLTLVSASSGKVLWQQQAEMIQTSNATVKSHDINGDGQLDLLLFYHFGGSTSNSSWLRWTCRDGLTGEELWYFDVARNIANPDFLRPSFESRVLDINGDGHADVLCPCFDSNGQPRAVAIDGKTGKPIWALPLLFGGISASSWQSEVILSDQGNASVFATAWEGRSSKGKRQLNVNFFDLATGDPVSTWSADGGFAKSQVAYGERSRIEKIPLMIADGDQRFVGIMHQGGKHDELVVLDFRSATATEIRRISRGRLVLVDDLNGDGKTEGVFLNAEKEFITIELASGKEINRIAPYWLTDFASVVAEPGAGFMRVETRQGGNRQLKLIDPATLELHWAMNWPVGTDFGGQLCGDAPVSRGSLPPKVLFAETLGSAAMVATASAAQFAGSPDSFGQSFQLGSVDHRGGDLTPASFVCDRNDPRLIEPLPWNVHGNAMEIFEISGIAHGPIELMSQLFPLVLGGLVFPAWLVYTMLRRKRWSLQWMLLLPLVFVLPYIFFQLPSSLGSEYRSSAIPLWQGKLFAAIKLLPFLIFIAVFAKWLFHGQWKRLLLLIVLSLAIPFCMAVSEIASTKLLEGGRFDWSDPASLWLLWASVWAGGVGLAIFWPLAFLAKLCLRLFRRRRDATGSVEPAAT